MSGFYIPSYLDYSDGEANFKALADSFTRNGPIRFKSISGTYTTVPEDTDVVLRCDSTTEIVLPADVFGEDNFRVGAQIAVLNYSEKRVVIEPAEGVTVKGPERLSVDRWRWGVLVKQNANLWLLSLGNMGGGDAKGVPLPPKITACFGVSAGASVEWSAPVDDGGSPITQYIVEESTDEKEWQGAGLTKADETNLTVNDLIPGTKYFFRVKAVNANGISDPSNVGEATPTENFNDASGGQETTFTLNGRFYRSHSFLSGTANKLTVNKAINPFQVLVVGGGGGGGGAGNYSGSGGGGAGGVIQKTMNLTAGDYNISIGAGSSGKGQDTVFDSLTAVGGGQGGGVNGNGSNGGSGGGGGGKHDDRQGAGGSGVSGQGNAGSAGGGGAQYQPGGGGGGAGTSGGLSAGGTGVSFLYLDGTERWFGGGGGGGGSQYGAGGPGGKGGGGIGGQVGTNPGGTGVANTGGGGGGGSGTNGPTIGPGPGGSGIVVVAYEIAPFNDAEGGTSTTTYEKDGATFKVHTFTNGGNLIVKKSHRPFRVLVVGGGGGTGSNWGCDTCCGDAGGSGAGYHYAGDSDVLPVGEYAIAVGNGGSAAGARQIGGGGGSSSFIGEGINRVANGGEGGGQSGSGCCQDRGCRVDGKGGSQIFSDITGTAKPYAGSGGPGSNVSPDPGKNGVAGTVIVSYQIG